MYQKFLDFFLYCVKHTRQVDCLGRAAILAFTTMFSLVPLLFIITTIINVLPKVSGISSEVEIFMLDHISVVDVDYITKSLQDFLSKAHDLSPLGIFFLFISSMLLFLEIENSFDKIWRVSKSRHSFISIFMHGFLMLLLPLLFTLIILLEYYLPLLSEYFFLFSYIPSYALVLMLSVIIFTVMYTIIPSCSVNIKYSFFAAIFSSFLFVLLKHAMIFYFSYFTGYNVIYGAFASLPIFMIWLYCSWLVILIGAVITYAAENYTQ
jgi:membrane protein